jgi:hypothetical protein
LPCDSLELVRKPVETGMDLAHLRARTRRLAGFFGARGFTGLIPQRLAHFLTSGVPHPCVVPRMLAVALGLAGAPILIGAVRALLFVAGPRGGTRRLAQPRRGAEQIGFDLAFDIAVAATITPPMTVTMTAATIAPMAVPGIAFVAASVAALIMPALRSGLRFVVGIETGAAVLTAVQAARRIV